MKWFETPLGVYKNCKPKFVEFKDKSNTGTAPPDSRHLALHRALAHVLHDTGIGTYLDTVIENFAPDASTYHTHKFSVTDLELKTFFLDIAGPRCRHLPN